ncbi:hypothetical protein N7476_010473 [Penicillium atrosanguineum]|uniref:Uncharacterized protein n=2 Tax=Penicillium atrosanguineum TaxID=1132637 RepID=A0A9W9U1V9_9EURO|nr:hypothetical protein N7526_007358 [Penicillium atrosanguineum]KAJ5303674.1 hypothetical protein N7476_010473 [Penicillium atrosanguineum]
MVMFLGEVANWRWGLKQPEEWGKRETAGPSNKLLSNVDFKAQLKLEEQDIVRESVGVMDPILELRAKGDMFPTVWYGFDVQCTAVRHFRLAQLRLTAEDPNLEIASRAAHRKAEAQVRSIVMNLCGIAIHHLKVQPCMMNAVIAISLYGDYFTDQGERNALIGIINRTKDIHA